MRTLLCSLLAVALSACSFFELPAEPVTLNVEVVKITPAPIQLRILGELKDVFPVSDMDVPNYFNALDVMATKACSDVGFRAFFSDTLWEKYPHGLAKLIAGCYTFFTMNDLNTYHSFERVKRLIPGPYNCHTVAFTQLYIMHDVMECETVTAIDINWRILWAHYQFLEAFKTGKLKLADIKAEPGRITGIGTFCYRPEWEICKSAFEMAMQKYGMIQRTELQLSFLHDMEFNTDKEVVLLFVSNAIDPGYTTKKQFDRLTDRLFSALKPYQKAVVIYHAGGNAQYSIYQLKRTETDVRIIDTLCRDDLVWAPYYSTRGQKFKTYFDQISKTTEAPICTIDLQD